MSGSPRPPLKEVVKCTLAVGDNAILHSGDSKFFIIGPDARYFIEGKEYTIDVDPLPENAAPPTSGSA